MELQLTLLIIMPLVGMLLELVVPKFFKRTTGFISIFIALAVLALAIAFVYSFNYDQKGVQFIFNTPWIQDWGINFKIALDGLSCIFILLFSSIFLITSILAKSDNENSFYYAMLMLLESSVLGFLLSYDFVVKILFWEMTWIPVFFLFAASSKKQFAITYSKYWFLSQLFIITGAVLLFSVTSMSYDLEKINLVQISSSKTTSTIFFFFIAGMLIRISIFPFDACIRRSVQSCNQNISILTTILLPLLPFVFILNIILPIFHKEFIAYTDILAAIALVSLFICVVRLFTDKKLSTVISSQIIIFNALTFLWLIRPYENLLKASLELIVTKAALNILIIYFGRQIIIKQKDKDPVNEWMFITSLILSFGIPGFLVIKPLFVLISNWQGIAPYASILICLFLVIAFVYTSVNITPLLSKGPEQDSKLKIRVGVSTVLLLVAMIITVSLSIAPYSLHDLSASYYKIYLSRWR